MKVWLLIQDKSCVVEVREAVWVGSGVFCQLSRHCFNHTNCQSLTDFSGFADKRSSGATEGSY